MHKKAVFEDVLISREVYQRGSVINNERFCALVMEIVWGIVKAFIVGGAICVIGQLLIDLTKMTPAKVLVGFVVAGVVLGALGLYEPLVNWAGCGATVPLTGFGYALVDGTKKAIAEDGLLGVLTGPLCSASAGVTAAVFFGLLLSFIAKPKAKS